MFNAIISSSHRVAFESSQASADVNFTSNHTASWYHHKIISICDNIIFWPFFDFVYSFHRKALFCDHFKESMMLSVSLSTKNFLSEHKVIEFGLIRLLLVLSKEMKPLISTYQDGNGRWSIGRWCWSGLRDETFKFSLLKTLWMKVVREWNAGLRFLDFK